MLTRLLSIGVQKNFSRTRKFRIRMVNAIAYLVIILSSIHTILHLVVGDNPLMALIQFGYCILSFIVLLLNHRGKYDVAESFMHIAYPIWIVIVAVFLGSKYQMELYIIITIIGAYFIFAKTIQRFYYSGYAVVLLIGVRVYFNYHPEGLLTLTDDALNWMYISHLLFPLAILSILTDNTLQNNIRLYDKLQKITNNQEKVIEERTQEVFEKSKAIQQSSEELKRFSYISAHDLREPLRNIMSFSQLLEKDVDNGKSNNIKEYLSYIAHGINRIDIITKDIVNYTELESYINKTEQVDTSFIVHKIIHETINAGQPIIFNLENLPKVQMNGQLCHLLFSNLIDNAAQYCDKPELGLNISALSKDKFYQFSITDNGKGIRKEYYELIFEMFKRLHNDIDKSGSGIGLAICKKIVNAYGGKIWVTSEIGKGSTFYFTLPRLSTN